MRRNEGSPSSECAAKARSRRSTRDLKTITYLIARTLDLKLPT